MFIKFTPELKNTRANTNLGEFVAGDHRGPYEGGDEIEAKRLIANGDFVECDPAGNEIGGAPAAAPKATKPSPKK